MIRIRIVRKSQNHDKGDRQTSRSTSQGKAQAFEIKITYSILGAFHTDGDLMCAFIGEAIPRRTDVYRGYNFPNKLRDSDHSLETCSSGTVYQDCVVLSSVRYNCLGASCSQAT